MDRVGNVIDRRNLSQRLVGLETTILEMVEFAIIGRRYHEVQPPFAEPFAIFRRGLENSQHHFRSMFHQHKEADRIVVFDHLQRQPRSQIAVAAVSYSDESHNVVGQLGASPHLLDIHSRKVILKVNPSADARERSQNIGQNLSLGILLIIIGLQESPSIQEEALEAMSSSDEAQGIGSMTQFRAWLKVGMRTLFDRPPDFPNVLIHIDGGKPPSSFLGIEIESFLDIDQVGFVILAPLLGELNPVIVTDFIARGVVHRREEVSRFGNVDFPALQDLPYSWVIRHVGKDTGIRRARSPTTSSTIVGTVVGIVGTTTAVSHDINHLGEIRNEANSPQDYFHHISHLRHSVTGLNAIDFLLRIIAFDVKLPVHVHVREGIGNVRPHGGAEEIQNHTRARRQSK